MAEQVEMRERLVKAVSQLGERCRKLFALKLANFVLALGDRENGNLGALPQVLDIIHIAVTDRPANLLGNRGFCYAAKPRCGDGLHYKRAGPGDRRGLDDL